MQRKDGAMQDVSMPQGRGRRGGMDVGFNAVASDKTALLAGLTLGSPDFQRR